MLEENARQWAVGVGEVEDGVWMRRGASPVVRSRVRKDDKENRSPWRRNRRRKSPLPVWYPRTPLRDITAIVAAFGRRRMRMLQAAAERRNLGIGTESSPLLLFSSSPVSLDSSASGQTRVSPVPTSDVSVSETAVNPTALATATTPSAQESLQSSPSPASFLPTDHSSSVPIAASPAEYSEQTATSLAGNQPAKCMDPVKLWCSIDEIESALMKNLKKDTVKPAKDTTRKRTLLSMR